MNEQRPARVTRREKGASWISMRPLSSVAAAATIAFMVGVGTPVPDSPDRQLTAAPANASSIDVLEEDLQDVRAELEDSKDETVELRADNTMLKRKLSEKITVVRRTRGSLSATRTKLRKVLAAARSASVAAAPPVLESSSDTSGSKCDPNYKGTCVPIVSYDLNCDDISGSVSVVGSDRHGFDGDGDGSGCE